MRERLTRLRRARVAAACAGALCAAATSAHAQNPPEAIEYYATDALGSVRVVYNSTGQVLGRSAYLPFGETLDQNGALPRQRFTGQERDGEAGFDYLNARDLQTRTGRMNAPDPLFGNAMTSPQRWNRYSYVGNNPLRMTDPSGLSPVAKDSQFFSADMSMLEGLSGGGGPLSLAASGEDIWTWTQTSDAAFGDWAARQITGSTANVPLVNMADVTTSYSLGGTLPAVNLGGSVTTTPAATSITPQSVLNGASTACFAQLKYRPVDIIGTTIHQAVHTFWYVQGSDARQYIVSGGPTSNGGGYLNVGVQSNLYKGPDTPNAATWWSTGSSALSCAGADNLLAAARSFPNNSIQYNAVLGPNSNSAAHYLGTQGPGVPWGPPAISYGWYTGIR
jgi:RHS repeat-associated protein